MHACTRGAARENVTTESRKREPNIPCEGHMLVTTFLRSGSDPASACAETVPVEESSVAPVSQCLDAGGSLSPVVAPVLTPF